MSATPLSVSDSSIKIANAALSEIGLKPITDFEAGSLSARTLNTRYADILEEVLGSYPWRFARTRVEMARSADEAFPPWAALYQMPDVVLAVHAVYEGDQKVIFDVFKRQIATMTAETSTDPVSAEVTVTMNPDTWPGYFRRAFIVKLSSAICMTLTQDERMAAFLMQDAERKLALAKSRDAQGRTPSRLDTSLFVRARRRGHRI